MSKIEGVRQIMIRVTPEMHESLRILAFEQRTSTNALIVQAIDEMLKKNESAQK